LHVYRLVRREFASPDPFSGEGSFLYGGRWSSPGTRVSYASTYRSLAVLEYRAHIDPTFAGQDLVIAELVIPDDVLIAATPPLPENWRQTPAPETLREVGDQFVAAGGAAAMLVPSVIVPEESNVLINPRHPDMERVVRVAELVEFRFDSRLL
jgi:RES domain-containing protein